MFGSTIRRKTVSWPAPSERAASSISRSSSSRTGWTVRIDEGQRDEEERDVERRAV